MAPVGNAGAAGAAQAGSRSFWGRIWSWITKEPKVKPVQKGHNAQDEFDEGKDDERRRERERLLGRGGPHAQPDTQTASGKSKSKDGSSNSKIRVPTVLEGLDLMGQQQTTVLLVLGLCSQAAVAAARSAAVAQMMRQRGLAFLGRLIGIGSSVAAGAAAGLMVFFASSTASANTKFDSLRMRSQTLARTLAIETNPLDKLRRIGALQVSMWTMQMALDTQIDQVIKVASQAYRDDRSKRDQLLARVSKAVATYRRGVESGARSFAELLGAVDPTIDQIIAKYGINSAEYRTATKEVGPHLSKFVLETQDWYQKRGRIRTTRAAIETYLQNGTF